MNIYLAGSFFNPKERKLIEDLAKVLRDQKHEVFVPMEHFIEDGDTLSNCLWGQKVFQMDVKALTESDIIIAVYDGHYSDTGVAWEIGYAYALQDIKVIICHVKEQVSSIMINNGSDMNIFYDDLLNNRITVDELVTMPMHSNFTWLTIQK